nr:hypothetical protein GCM10017547_04860 [Pseudarthrobacter oxydans]
MGFFSTLFNGLVSSSDGNTNEEEATLTCDSCGDDVDENEMQEGQCEECYNSDYSGPTYCCGAIYEEGEDTCMSCGEPL